MDDEALRREVMRKVHLSELNRDAPVPEMWARSSPVTHRDDYAVVEVVARRKPAGTPKTKIERPRDVSRYRARVKQAMMSILAENPDADLVGPGACGLVASRAGVALASMSEWFTGSGTQARYVVRDLLPEATEEAQQKRRSSAEL